MQIPETLLGWKGKSVDVLPISLGETHSRQVITSPVCSQENLFPNSPQRPPSGIISPFGGWRNAEGFTCIPSRFPIAPGLGEGLCHLFQGVALTLASVRTE
jgi:hypothetical protein